MTGKIHTHEEAIEALCGCAATVSVLSYQEAIEGYFKLRGLDIPDTAAETWVSNGGDGEYPDLVVDPSTAEDASMASGEERAWFQTRAALKGMVGIAEENEVDSILDDLRAALRTTPADPRPYFDDKGHA